MSTVGYGNIYPIDEFCTCVMVVQVRRYSIHVVGRAPSTVCELDLEAVGRASLEESCVDASGPSTHAH